MNKIFNGETLKETFCIIALVLAMKTKTKFNYYVVGTIFGMANTLSSFGGFLSSYIVGKLTNNNVSENAFNIKIQSHTKSIICILLIYIMPTIIVQKS